MDINNKREIICINCNKIGHTFKQCHQPISSYGIIAFKLINKSFFFLMICRKDTFHYVEFMRGRYDLEDKNYINSLLDGFTNNERDIITKYDFDYLWTKLWMSKNQERYNREYYDSKNKFNILMNEKYLINYFVKYDVTWLEPEWGFPKGRRNLGEDDLECAKREFEEETGLINDQYQLIDTTSFIKEIFIGTNNLKYKHVYYIAFCNSDVNVNLDKSNLDQISEVSNIEWVEYNECLNRIRPYNIEKINVLKTVYNKIINLNL